MGVGGYRHTPTALAMGKEAVPIVYEAGWAPGSVWSGAENLTTTGTRSPAVQPVTSHYTENMTTNAGRSPHFQKPACAQPNTDPDSTHYWTRMTTTDQAVSPCESSTKTK